MGEAKRRRASDPNWRQPKAEAYDLILNSDEIMAVFTAITGDCMWRCLVLSELIPGGKIQAGQVFFWDKQVRYYDTIFSWHSWLVADGKIYDSHNQLGSLLTQYQFSQPPLEKMSARTGSLTEGEKLAGRAIKTTDAVYVPGLLYSPKLATSKVINEVVSQTRLNGCVDIAWAKNVWRYKSVLCVDN